MEYFIINPALVFDPGNADTALIFYPGGKVEGLILLASYSTADISSSGMRVMIIYGSKDGVLNKESYQNNKSNLPANFTEKVLRGGNHAGFGCYGPQQGDGKGHIISEQQQTDTAQAVAGFCLTANGDE